MQNINITENPGRHAVLTEVQIDDISKAQLSSNSEKQTKWAVTLFRGMYKCTIVF